MTISSAIRIRRSFVIYVGLFFLGLGLGYNFFLRPWITNPVSSLFQSKLSGLDKKLRLPDVERLKDHVLALTNIQPSRNFANPGSLNSARGYIRTQWENIGFEVHEQKYMANQNEYSNLIVEIGPKDKPLIVVGAHYDVCEDQPGADDNASGVAGLIELSRMVWQEKNSLNHRIQFVAYTLEEPPAYDTPDMGSLVHAKSLRESNENVRLMISMEMIGYFSEAPGSQNFPLDLMKLDYPSVGNFIALVSNSKYRDETRQAKELMMVHSNLPLFSINSPEFIPGIDYSDHRSYWAMGYPALMITDTSFYRNSNYHKPTDTPDTLNYKAMAEVVSGIAGLIIDWDSTNAIQKALN